MTDVFQRQTRELQGRLAEAGIDLLLLNDPARPATSRPIGAI